MSLVEQGDEAAQIRKKPLKIGLNNPKMYLLLNHISLIPMNKEVAIPLLPSACSAFRGSFV